MTASDTRGSRRTLRSFWRPLAELKMTCSPSKSHHTGVTCGLPSGMSVPRLANARFWNRSRYFSGMTCGMNALHDCEQQQGNCSSIIERERWTLCSGIREKHNHKGHAGTEELASFPFFTIFD